MSERDRPRDQYLRALSYRFPSADAVLAEIAHLRAVTTLPRGAVHVVSDVHGEFSKLDHILRNGSGSLRPWVERLLSHALDASAQSVFLNLVYYPRETLAREAAKLATPAERAAFVRASVAQMFTLMRALGARYSLRHLERRFPETFGDLFAELLDAPLLGREPSYVEALIAPYLADDGGIELVRAAAHALRSLTTYELIVAGDLGDRGPRIDRVIDTLRHQRNLTITWGNHDAEWMGACLGQEALIATVLRVSLRYGRIAQLEEGYGIPVEPLEQLANEAYGDDPAERFRAKGEDIRAPLLLARMQKAAAILQLKLEGQTARRNPHFDLERRNLLHRIDYVAGTVDLNGTSYPLLDKHFPTIDPEDPYRLSAGEARCLALLKRAFLDSPALWSDMRWVADRGGMYALRDEHIVFHGCVPTGDDGAFVDFPIEGVPRRGRALFDAIDRVVRRAFRDRAQADVDLLYYLWAGPRSPLFGKDKMATFETCFLADKATHKETKGAYFERIHDVEFCRRVADEFGVERERVLIVNGHMPVQVEAGESPLKRSGLAVTIDGAFSEAYGDHGYTLVIDADRTYLARHHHFESVAAAIERGADVVPTVEDLRVHDRSVRVADTARGAELAREIAGLEQLLLAYRDRTIEPPTS
ncbi:MAG: fructose-bisphosphatase class III [Polyangiales bacterium]